MPVLKPPKPGGNTWTLILENNEEVDIQTSKPKK
jgi:hypothetical protein